MELCETCLYLGVKLGAHTGRNPWHFKRGVSDLESYKRGLCFFTKLRVRGKKCQKADAMSVIQKALLVMWPFAAICLSVPLISILENTKGRGEDGRGGKRREEERRPIRWQNTMTLQLEVLLPTNFFIWGVLWITQETLTFSGEGQNL